MRTNAPHPLLGPLLAAAAALLLLAGCSTSVPTPQVAPASVATGAVAGAGVPVQADATAAPEALPSAAAPTASERQVARTAALTLGITDPGKSAKDVRATAESLGGYVLDENVITEQKDGFYVQASTVTVSVPSAKLDDALDALAKLGDVRSRAVTASDVTIQVVDTDARIRVMRESIARVEALLARAGSITEIAQVERELTSRQSQLESLVAQQQALANRVAMAPITVTLRPAATATDPNPLWEGLTAGWAALLTSLRVLITALGAVLPFAVLAGLAWLAVWAWRRRRRHQAHAAASRAHTAAPASPEASTEDAPDEDASGVVDASKG